ncbi:hypothetical protein A2272_05785 [Candidatus Peregrinibacteria bacterium RIFOXYA12_FULL_33_12]|nr:MAG: hypothetical protein A2272_05785 [Candidatus Peregrinibacteria bacterium RIFOXYA12_FULL_33_12]OGJ44483.1 MAG: hypothetical protein A2263_00375 [Candidatus Peregrinibacteria bacterium RIFOXYA2_FULL_33_21]OGJ50233.1 MAG: hypothetical protein A2307_06630 [Candidatus Peregrinibacteria bacterium RIFOXYB2_FULL_33_20]
MNIIKLENNGNLFFTTEDISRILNISDASSRVFCSRYVNKKILIRLKKDIYILKEKINLLEREDLFFLSNLIQTPSYISFMTAMAYFEVTTQMTRNIIEAVSVIRTKTFDSENFNFIYKKLKNNLYFSFNRIGKFFIATKEKAFLDCLYFQSLGRYDFDIESIDFNKLDLKILKKLSKKFPFKTQKLLNQLIQNSKFRI